VTSDPRERATSRRDELVFHVGFRCALFSLLAKDFRPPWSSLPQEQLSIAQAIEHLQFLQPRQCAQAAALGLLGLYDLLDGGAHG
jgi:hypothetical protein